ncbi:MAG: DegT/DnrJ/EryC1/StrS aminotransferase family protein [Syntrophales bacterium]|jgi:dTDP-4-amino-4,6-dideoxygalactose transaminase|nr:DegT/DnrJ/EryC1/StrS aminotransferase family protein [Syntrophales bacterium]MCU0583689.1 DegT/DnrJ/EryC1/StrS aminotransferase family protein [Syntrophales bacterium]
MTIKVRIGDIRIGREETASVLESLAEGQLSEGRKTKEFEKLWARYIGTKHCVALNSGSSALLAGLHALIHDVRRPKVRPGCRVITSPVTYVATSNAVVLAGMEPVYVDIDSRTFTLDINQVEDVLRRDRKGHALLLPVHLMGYVNDMDALNDLARRYDLAVFEDAAQAHGSLYKGRRAGSLSDLAEYSFYIAHNIQVGEMGAVVTDDEALCRLIRRIKANGRLCDCRVCRRSAGKCPHRGAAFDPRFTHDLIGFNFKTAELHAAIAIPQVGRADAIIRARQHNVRALNAKLEPYAEIFQLPVYSEEVSYLAYPLVIRDPRWSREKIMTALERAGVETRPLFGCIPTQQPAYRSLQQRYEGRLPRADFAGKNGFYIGCHQYLGRADLDCVEEAFRNLVRKGP